MEHKHKHSQGLKPKSGQLNQSRGWQEFFDLTRTMRVPDDFLAGRGNKPPQKRQLLETQEERDRWLVENRTAIDVKICRGVEQLDRGEGIPEDQVDGYLARLKAHKR